MLILDQFGVIQNLQMSPIPHTSLLPWTFLPLLTAILIAIKRESKQTTAKTIGFEKIEPNAEEHLPS